MRVLRAVFWILAAGVPVFPCRACGRHGGFTDPLSGEWCECEACEPHGGRLADRVEVFAFVGGVPFWTWAGQWWRVACFRWTGAESLRCRIGWHRWGPWFLDAWPRMHVRPDGHAEMRMCRRCGRGQARVVFPKGRRP